MSSDSVERAIHIEIVDVGGGREKAEDGSKSLVSCDSGVETLDSTCGTCRSSSDSEVSPEKVGKEVEILQNGSEESCSESSSPTSLSSDKENCFLNFDHNSYITENLDTGSCNISNDCLPEVIRKSLYVNRDNTIATSSVSLNDHQISQNNLNSPISRSAENISTLPELVRDDGSTTSSTKELDRDKILLDFASQKTKVTATQKEPETPQTLDVRYTRIPKDILSPDIGSIVKNVHGIFSSVSGSLKNAYNNSHRVSQKPQIKNVKTIANGKIMSDIFEDVSDEKLNEALVDKTPVESNSTSMESVSKVGNEDSEPKHEMLKLQIESLERVLFEQRKENASLRERVKQQVDELQAKDHTFKELEAKVDLVCIFFLRYTHMFYTWILHVSFHPSRFIFFYLMPLK